MFLRNFNDRKFKAEFDKIFRGQFLESKHCFVLVCKIKNNKILAKNINH